MRAVASGVDIEETIKMNDINFTISSPLATLLTRHLGIITVFPQPA